MNAYVRKGELPYINHVRLHLWKLENEEQVKSK